MFSWITGPHKLQYILRNDYIRICPAVVCITTHFQAVIIHLLCSTSRPTSVSNLYYAQALPGMETAAARNRNTGVSLNNVTAAERALPLAGPQRTSGGPQLEKIHSRATRRQKAAVEPKMCLKEDGKQGVIGWCQRSGKHFIWWDRLKRIGSYQTSNERFGDESWRWWIDLFLQILSMINPCPAEWSSKHVHSTIIQSLSTGNTLENRLLARQLSLQKFALQKESRNNSVTNKPMFVFCFCFSFMQKQLPLKE